MRLPSRATSHPCRPQWMAQVCPALRSRACLRARACWGLGLMRRVENAGLPESAIRVVRMMRGCHYVDEETVVPGIADLEIFGEDRCLPPSPTTRLSL